MKQTKKTLTPLWLVILLDVLILAALMSVFCYYHHIRDIWGEVAVGDDPAVTEPPVMVITKPPRPTAPATTTTVTPKPPTTPSVPETKPLPETGPAGTQDAVTTAPKPPEPPVVTEPALDTSGDFGYLHADKFAPKGEVNKGDGYYQSHDISIKVTEVDTTIEQYSTKNSTKKSKTHVRYYIADVYVRNIENLFASYNTEENVSFENLLQGTNAMLAISGDMFRVGSASKELIIRNGNVIRYKEYISSDICVLYWDGTMETITPEEYNWNKILAKAPYQVWCFGPELLGDDGSVIDTRKSAVWRLNPRSAIGYVEPGHYVLLSVHGARGTIGTDGVNMEVLAQIMSEAGCKQAYNLDGGASVYSYYDGKMLVEFSDKRKLCDIICVGEIG